MVNRIDGHNPYEYPKLQNVDPNNRAEAGEKFSLDYGKGTNLSGEDQKENIDQIPSERGRDRKAESDGVRLELSGQGQRTLQAARADGRDAERSKDAQPPLWESLRRMARSVADKVKAFFWQLWYDAPKKEDESPEADSAKAEEAAQEIQEAQDIRHAGEDTAQQGQTDTAAVLPPPTAEELTYRMRREEARIDKEVQPYLKSGDLSQVVSLLTDNGKRTVAHNSTLLTYYDRNGNLIEPNASDRERILRGDRNARQM